MTIKTLLNSEGEIEDSFTEIRIQGSGGKLGKIAVENLAWLIKMFQEMRSEEEIEQHRFVITGYVMCCMGCGFLTAESGEEVTKMIISRAAKERERVAAVSNEGNI